MTQIKVPLARFARYAFLSSAIITCPLGALNAASFLGLGDLTGGTFYSGASDISADGSTVVGSSQSALGMEAFRWTASTGMVSLGDLAGGSVNSTAWGVSADGSVIVGMGTTADTFTGHKAFKWTEATGMVELQDIAGESNRSQAMGVSADGSTIVGYVQTPTSGSARAVTWTNSVNVLPVGSGSFGKGISSNGEQIVGSTTVGRVTSSFLYSQNGGLTNIPAPSDALGISGDGSTVVGIANFGSGAEAFRYSLDGGIQGLGDLVGGLFDSGAQDVSFDGSIIVGRGRTENGYEAFIWTQSTGMISLKSLLIANGVFGLDQWRLDIASGISDDGLTIVGTGTNPLGQNEAWIARLEVIPEPATVLLLLLGALMISLAVYRSRKTESVPH